MTVMQITDFTVGLAVSDLPAARAWYEKVFELGDPSLLPMEGVAEYNLGSFWLQLDSVEVRESSTVLRLGVEDIDAEHARFAELGVDADEITRIPDLLSYFDFRDIDGNVLSLYQVV
jgi:predicted enzyme related to lactoylglutathione lyase